MNDKKTTRLLAQAGIFAALVFIATALLKIPMPLNGEYMHLGDGMIYLAADLLPLPYAVMAAAVGAAFADILGGAAMWAPATVIIKALMTVFFSLLIRRKNAKSLFLLAAFLAAGAVNVLGYFLAEKIMYGVLTAGIVVVGNIAQSVAASLLFLLLRKPFQKIEEQLDRE